MSTHLYKFIKLWLPFLKYRIRDLTIKYSQKLKLDRTKKERPLDNKLIWSVERGDSSHRIS